MLLMVSFFAQYILCIGQHVMYFSDGYKPVTLNNASDYRALSDYIGWTNGLTDYRANALMD